MPSPPEEESAAPKQEGQSPEENTAPEREGQPQDAPSGEAEEEK